MDDSVKNALVLIVAVSTMLTFFAVSLLHGYWAMGGQWARNLAVPEVDSKPAFKPGRAATLAVALLLLAAGALVGLTAHLWTCSNVPHGMAEAGVWAVGAVMLLRFIGDFRYFGVFKRVKGTRFARLDRAVYAPLCLALGCGCAIVALLSPA